MFDYWCFGCGGEMTISEELFLSADSPDQFICDVCVSHNNEVSSWYDDDSWALASAGWGTDEDY
jgi:hypothetical protein